MKEINLFILLFYSNLLIIFTKAKLLREIFLDDSLTLQHKNHLPLGFLFSGL